MNKGRKTTFEERIEIAKYAIANDLNYQKAIAKYGVSISKCMHGFGSNKLAVRMLSRTIAVAQSL